jgi:hypothetical protein
LASCEREEITTDTSAKLAFSNDTISFDTVFTSLGSATKRLMIYNHNDKPINISSLRLLKGKNSFFKLNVDGIPGNEVSNVRIEANDSSYIFIQVFIDPGNQNSPLLIEDSLECISNTNKYIINLRALGQDVHLLKGDSVTISKDTTWHNDKPYLIWGNLFIDTSKTLTIEKGTRIFLHSKTWIIADGNLVVNGTKEEPVIFRGDRFDKANYAPPIPYDKIPGQWGQIWLRNASKNSKLTYAFIRNAEFGLIVGNIKDGVTIGDTGQARVELNNCKIENSSIAALYGNGGKIKAVNSIFANSGYFNFSTSTGGYYDFFHCTFANYPAIGSKDGRGVVLLNYAEIQDSKGKKTVFKGDLEKAYFGNCIIFGDVEDQLYFQYVKDKKFEYLFDHCLIRGNTDLLEISNINHFIKSKISKDNVPVFTKTDKENYIFDWSLLLKSLARDMGKVEIATEYAYDFINNYRLTDEIPDAGAFEYIVKIDSK